MDTKELDLSIRVGRRGILALLTAFFVCWHPGFIGSETLQLTTYYPAPYGGYVNILTTSNTTLARDNGNVGVGTSAPAQKFQVNSAANSAFVVTTAGNVGIGLTSPAEKLDVNGTVKWGTNRGRLVNDQGASIELGGTGTPYIDFSRNASEDFSARLILIAANTLRIEGNLQISGTLTGMCERRTYTVGPAVSCTAGYSVMGFLGDGTPRVQGFLPLSATSVGTGTYIVLGEDWGGTMICCKFF